jgi:hypothetical protein
VIFHEASDGEVAKRYFDYLPDAINSQLPLFIIGRLRESRLGDC